MQNLNDRAKLAQVEEQAFIEACTAEFVERSLAATNAKKARTLGLISYLPNLISALTAGFFVLFLLSAYPRMIQALLGLVLIAVVVAVELGKRGLIAGISKTYFVSGKVAGLAVAALCILIAVSMGASYMGGKQLITETDVPPEMEVNPQIATLSAQLASQQETIQRLQKTTWKGKVTSDAVRGINQAKKIEADLLSRITALQDADEAAYSAVLAAHDSQRLNFGYLLGLIASLSDMFLLGLLWTAKRLRFEVAAIHHRQQAAASTTANNPYLTAQPVQIPPPSMNQKQPARPIGFFRDEPDNDSPYDKSLDDPEAANDSGPTINSNDKSYEVVTVTEKEVVELTDRVKSCAHCGERFAYYNSKAKYCSDACRIAAWEKRTGRTWRKTNS